MNQNVFQSLFTSVCFLLLLFKPILAVSADLSCSLTVGSRFQINLSDLDDVEELTRKPKVYLDVSGKKTSAKVITNYFPAKTVDCEWRKKVSPGTYSLYLERGDGDRKTVLVTDDCEICSPVIFSAMPSSGTAGEKIVLTGKYFGCKKPKLTLSVNGKSMRCRLIKPFAYEAGKSCMNVETGDSRLSFVVPNGVTGDQECELVIDNGIDVSKHAFNDSALEDFNVCERWYSEDSSKMSIGIANLRNQVSMSGTDSIEKNKERILKAVDAMRSFNVNMVIFPEFSLTGYFWDESEECWEYMRAGVTDKHTEWLEELKSKLDENLQYIIFNNIRLNPADPEGKFHNSTYVVSQNFNAADLDSENNEKNHIYDKTFLPGIEKKFTVTGQDDYLVVETNWGKMGFSTCYDMCFTQLFQEYAFIHDVDAMIQVSSWRGSSSRSYAGMDVKSDHYYGFIWDLMAPSQAAFNQVWLIACNAVGEQERGNYEFWGGSGLWAPSGLELAQASNTEEMLLIIHNVDIEGQTSFEHKDFYYYDDFILIYSLIEGKRAFTRMKD